MNKTKEIIKVHLHCPFNEKSDYYFSNLANMYSILTPQILGICRQSVINAKLYQKRFYANSFCTMEIVTVD